MNIVVWIVTALLAAMFAFAGFAKSTTPKEKLKEKGMAWVDDFSPSIVKVIGVLELLAGIGLILPALFDTATILVPLAAAGLVLTMIGAMIVHVRRGENQALPINAVLAVAALFVAIMRFGPEKF